MGGGKRSTNHQTHELTRIAPHPRTLRKARENVRLMVADGLSAQKIKKYFFRWAQWWVRAANTWDFKTLIEQFVRSCWHEEAAAIAVGVLSHYLSRRSDTCLQASDSIRAK